MTKKQTNTRHNAQPTGNGKKTAHTFVVSDESPNSYGFVVLTEGIDTAQFERNPVMLYMHERSRVVGRWENIRKEGRQLLADAVFDDSTELGAQVKAQVEKGFLRCASIGIENVIKKDLNGIQTVVKCELTEISIVDIPANGNAVKLYKKGGKAVFRLSDLDDTADTDAPDDLRTALLALLGFESDADDTQILDAVRKLVESPENVEDEIDAAVMAGYIEDSQRGNFRAMAAANRAAFLSFVRTKRAEQEPTVVRMVDEAAGKGKLLYQERGVYEAIGKRLGSKLLGDLLDTLPDPMKPTDFIFGARKSRAEWTLADYRKFAPEELRDDPELYARLQAREGRNAGAGRSLEWYRRNDPEYLRTHPNEYKRMLEKEKKNAKR